MKATAIIQARYSSTRLPGKVLMKVLDKTILEYVIERVARAESVDKVIVATSVNEADGKIADLLEGAGIDFFRGSENDVLDRFYRTALNAGAEHLVRITADCPLADPAVIDRIVRRYFDSGADYCSNTLEVTYPDGLDAEAFSFKALREAWESAGLTSEREHVTPFIYKHPEKFKLESFSNGNDLSEKRWTVDERTDFMFVKAVLEGLYPVKPDFHMEDVLGFLEDKPGLEDLNKGIVRNEGYIRSLAEDEQITTEG